MLFMVIHKHTGAECPVDTPAPVEKVASDEHAVECGVKVLGKYVSPPEHRIFFILEADTYEKIIAFLQPLAKIGTHRIHPVTDLATEIKILNK